MYDFEDNEFVSDIECKNKEGMRDFNHLVLDKGAWVQIPNDIKARKK